MGLYFLYPPPLPLTPPSSSSEIKKEEEERSVRKRISTRSKLKRLTSVNRRFLISLGFTVNK